MRQTAPQSWLRRIGSSVRKLRTDEGGSTVMEFAFVIPLFTVIALMIVYVGYLVMVTTLVNSAASNAAALFRKEPVTGSTLTKEAVEQNICDSVSSVLSCDKDKLKIYVVNWKNVDETTLDDPNAEDNGMTSKWDYDGDEMIHILRVGYKIDDFIPYLNFWLGNSTTEGYSVSPLILATKEEVPRDRDNF